jgi:hypothetical protein
MKVTSLDMPDSAEALDTIKEEVPEGVQVEELMYGLKAWDNPINGFRVLRLHYSADPKKRTPEWKAEERRLYGTAEWYREYELIWESMEGRAVYADAWDAGFHTSRAPLGWSPKLAVCRGWDFGLYGACLFGQLFPHGRLLILREAIGEDISFERFVEEVNRLSLEWFPGARFVEFVDPTGANRLGNDGFSYLKILRDAPLRAKNIIPGANAKVERKKAVIDFLGENVKGHPSYLVDPSCEYLIKGYNGGYFYPYRKGTLTTDPDKNIYSHIHDCNQYLCSRVKSARLDVFTSIQGGVRVLEPGYGKQRPHANEAKLVS